MDDLDAVALAEPPCGPVRTAHYLEIQLDGQPLGREPERLDQGMKRRALLNLPRLSVDLDRQKASPLKPAG
ncbi:MAG TPA: hypothetical protein VD968_19230 [Pyrinomonadaceae bacterium]|nr:hypothetical protein [Pyrinomonadaceae bacterium]